MNFPFVLILGKQAYQPNVLTEMLRRLGVFGVLHAYDKDQAMSQMNGCGGVDIILCDANYQTPQGIRFLKQAADRELFGSVIFYSENEGEQKAKCCACPVIKGFEILGELNAPLRIRQLHRLIHRYITLRLPLEGPLPRLGDLPSEESVRNALVFTEFRCWFQPKIHLVSGDLIGIEALICWEHPSKGVLPRRDFLAAVVAYDLIDELFRHSFEQGLMLLVILRRQGLDIEFSFNLHASQLNSDTLIDFVRDGLIRHALPGTSLMFEMVENGLLDMHPKATERLHRLRALGCGLAVSSFGIGFSSMKLLCQLPFKQIKLHPGFACSLSVPSSRVMVGAAVALSKSLNVKLVAEGVGSRRVKDALIGMGCENGQGNYLAWPMTWDGLLQWLHESNAGLTPSR